MCWAFRTLLHELQLRCWMFLSSLARGRPHVSEFCRATSAKCGIPSFCLCLHPLLSRCFALHLAFRLACGLRLLEATCVIGSSLFFPLLFVRVSCLDVVFAEMLLSFVSIFTQFAFVCGWQCISMFWTHSLCLWASRPSSSSRDVARSNSSSVRQMKPLPSRSNTLKVTEAFFFRVRVLLLCPRPSSSRPSETRILGNQWCRFRRHPLSWSCPTTEPLSDSDRGSHDCVQLLSGESVVAIFVERGKGFLELCSLLRQFQHGILCSEQSASLSEPLSASFCHGDSSTSFGATTLVSSAAWNCWTVFCISSLLYPHDVLTCFHSVDVHLQTDLFIPRRLIFPHSLAHRNLSVREIGNFDNLIDELSLRNLHGLCTSTTWSGYWLSCSVPSGSLVPVIASRGWHHPLDQGIEPVGLLPFSARSEQWELGVTWSCVWCNTGHLNDLAAEYWTCNSDLRFAWSLSCLGFIPWLAARICRVRLSVWILDRLQESLTVGCDQFFHLRDRHSHTFGKRCPRLV